MEQSCGYDLIIVVTNRGYTDEIMDAARTANATGGTALHARRVGVKEVGKFFGVSIQPEKEVILILAKTEFKQEIMKAVTARLGLQTNAKSDVLIAIFEYFLTIYNDDTFCLLYYNIQYSHKNKYWREINDTQRKCQCYFTL